MHKPYRDFADFLHERFPDFKVQKIAINAGFTCPNRDGSKGTGGCTYCNNQTFNPEYCRPSLSVGEQIEKGFKSMAYSLVFRHHDKTLEESEITAAMKKILNGLTALGIELRS